MKNAKCQPRRDTLKKEANLQRMRDLMVCFPRLCIRKTVFFSPWPLQSPFLGKSETKSREAAAGRESRTGKLALRRREGDRLWWSPHSMSERERSWSVWDSSGEHTYKHIDTKHETNKHACMHLLLFLSPFTHFCLPKDLPWDFSLEYFGCRFYWNAELKLVPLLSNQPQLLIRCYGGSAMLVKEKIFDIMATQLCTF